LKGSNGLSRSGISSADQWNRRGGLVWATLLRNEVRVIGCGVTLLRITVVVEETDKLLRIFG
jgi:hypothetical protein